MQGVNMKQQEDRKSLVACERSCEAASWESGLSPVEDPTETLSDDDSDEKRSSRGFSGDDLLATIRQRSGGVALYSILSISVSMALLSILALFQFETTVQDRSREPESIDNTVPMYPSEGVCAAESYSKPVWQELLELQINVIQNLIHASLFGAAALVAAIRGDVVWLYFSRNVGFFLFPVVFVCLVHDLGAIIWLQHDAGSYNFRIFVSFVMTIASGTAFVKYEAACRVVRRILAERMRSISCTPASTGKSSSLAGNSRDMAKANVIFYGALVSQTSNVLYAIVTAMQWFNKSVECSDSDHGDRRLEGTMEEDNETQTGGGDLLMFEMAYSLAAHQSYLLALILLASTFPRHFASVGGAILTSTWRLIVAIGSLMHIYLHWKGTSRNTFSLLYTCLEVVAMLPILLAATSLLRGIRKSQGKSKGYGLVEDGEESVDELSVDGLLHERASIEARFHCPTLSQIAVSDRYSTRQNWGARLLFLGTSTLLLEFTVECFALLRREFLGTSMAHEVWKWGMHVSSIYLFCAIMSVETPSIYRRTRVLLAIACPLGSLVGIWQLWMLVHYAENGTDDRWTWFVACLLALRIICGFTQTIGLFVLKNTEPSTDVVTEYSKAIDDELASSQTRANFALYKIYLPTFVAFVVGVAVLSNCSEPMVSSLIPTDSCAAMKMDFVLNKNWPGLGLFFHFGMLIVIGAVDGLSTGSPSYKPSLAIASLFAGHVTLLIFVSLSWDVLQTDCWEVLSVADVLRRMVLPLWMVASGYLFVCLDRHWRLRVLSM
jgi:hypothetical protein